MSQLPAVTARPFQSSELMLLGSSHRSLGLLCSPGISPSESVLPAHSAETLSRALSAVPIHTRHPRLNQPDDALSRAAGLTNETMTVLKQSLSVSIQAQTTLAKLTEHASANDFSTFVEREASRLLTLIRELQERLDTILSRARKVSQEIDNELTAIFSGENTIRRWKAVIRLGSVGISVPSFATAVVSAVYNNTNSAVALAMALISATGGVCAAVGPCIAQSFWDSYDSRRSSQACLQSVHVEVFRMQYPLELLLKWWRRLDKLLASFASPVQGGTVDASLCESMVTSIARYTSEIGAVVSSAICVEETPGVAQSGVLGA